VIITLLEADLEVTCTSVRNAAKEVGVCVGTIRQLANKTTKKSKIKCGDYAGQYFTARFLD